MDWYHYIKFQTAGAKFGPKARQHHPPTMAVLQPGLPVLLSHALEWDAIRLNRFRILKDRKSDSPCWLEKEVSMDGKTVLP